jgi:hypothetical protein
VKARQIGVIEFGHRQSFLKETLFDGRASGVLAVKFLDGDDATRSVYVFGFEDRAEPAAAQITDDAVISYLSASHRALLYRKMSAGVNL